MLVTFDTSQGHLDVTQRHAVQVLVLGLFFASLITIMVVRSVVPGLPILIRFFGNIFLAGTIIVGIFNLFYVF